MTTAPPSLFRSGQAWLGFALGMAGMVLLPMLIDSIVTAPDRGSGTVAATAEIAKIAAALQRYHHDQGRYPSKEEGIASLVPKYLPEVPKDPWGRPYVYNLTSDGQSEDVVSFGEDGVPGGRGASVDVSQHFGILSPPLPRAEQWTINSTFFVIPLIGLFAGGRWAWAAGTLAGGATLCAALLLPSGLVMLQRDPAGWIPLSLGVLCLAAAGATFTGVRYGRLLAFASIIATFIVLIGMPPMA